MDRLKDLKMRIDTLCEKLKKDNDTRAVDIIKKLYTLKEYIEGIESKIYLIDNSIDILEIMALEYSQYKKKEKGA